VPRNTNSAISTKPPRIRIICTVLTIFDTGDVVVKARPGALSGQHGPSDPPRPISCLCGAHFPEIVRNIIPRQISSTPQVLPPRQVSGAVFRSKNGQIFPAFRTQEPGGRHAVSSLPTKPLKEVRLVSTTEWRGGGSYECYFITYNNHRPP
jgi:hypothetical protein